MLIFANLLRNDPVNLVVRKSIVDERQISLDAPLIDRLEAIRGLKVGVAPGPVVVLRALFESVGMDVDNTIEVVLMDPESENEAFGSGAVDALYAYSPFLERALVDQDGVIIVNQSAGQFPQVNFPQIHSMATTQVYAAENPDVLVAISRGLLKAQQLIHDDLQATASALMQAIEGLNPQHLATIIEIYEPAIPQSPEVSVAGVVRVIDRFPDHRTPPDLTGIDLNDYVDPQFALRAVNGGDSPSGNRIPGSGGGKGDGSGGGNKTAVNGESDDSVDSDDNGY